MPSCEHIIKHNLRREGRENWFEYAKTNAHEVVHIRKGLDKYYTFAIMK